MDRFSTRLWKEHSLPFRSKYDISKYTPWDNEKEPVCDMCEEAQATLETDKAKVKFCRSCKENAMESYELTESDVSFI